MYTSSHSASRVIFETNQVGISSLTFGAFSCVSFAFRRRLPNPAVSLFLEQVKIPLSAW